eukprot:925956-Amphidinium_carterae.1
MVLQRSVLAHATSVVASVRSLLAYTDPRWRRVCRGHASTGTRRPPVRCMLIPDGEVVPRSVRGRYYRYREAVSWEELRQSVIRAKGSLSAEGWPDMSVKHAVKWTGEAVAITELLPEVVGPTPMETGGDEEWVALETRG